MGLNGVRARVCENEEASLEAFSCWECGILAVELRRMYLCRALEALIQSFFPH
jgi:hypothetical protein